MTATINTPKISGKRWYRIGIRAGEGNKPPYWSVTLGGICFPFRTISDFSETGEALYEAGTFAQLSAVQLAKIKSEAQRKVFRPRRDAEGKLLSWQLWDTELRVCTTEKDKDGNPIIGESLYEQHEGDVSVAAFLYIHEEAPKPRVVEEPRLEDLTGLTDLTRELENALAASREQDKAEVKAATKSEQQAQADPTDKATREKHGRLKRAGENLPTPE